MRYDLDLADELCSELGLRARRVSADQLLIHLEPNVDLILVNSDCDDDCRITLQGTPWHYHDDLICADRHGHHISLGYLDVLSGLAEGTVLLCERWLKGSLEDRWLVHRDFLDEFRFMDNGEEIRVRPVAVVRVDTQAKDA